MKATTEHDHRCGFVTVAGRPNVGKSTLVNRIVGRKLSITSNRPQTTRHRILGIASSDASQIVFVDTPGIHTGHTRALNRYMNRVASRAMIGVDLIMMVIEASGWIRDDDHILDRIGAEAVPVILVLNKIDRIKYREGLLPVLDDVARRYDFAATVPVCARTGENLERLRDVVEAHLPAGPPVFPQDHYTDRSEAFLAAEIVREKLIRRLGQELPHRLTVEIERFVEVEGRTVINTLVLVERNQHKAIVIGRGGARLKEAGSAARRDIARMLGRPVHLEVWVKVREGWSDDERALRGLGLAE
jgi:GTP-binding protein Era